MFFPSVFLKLAFTEIRISAKYFTFTKSKISDEDSSEKMSTLVRNTFYFNYISVTILPFSLLMVIVMWNVIGPHELNTDDKKERKLHKCVFLVPLGFWKYFPPEFTVWIHTLVLYTPSIFTYISVYQKDWTANLVQTSEWPFLKYQSAKQCHRLAWRLPSRIANLLGSLKCRTLARLNTI